MQLTGFSRSTVSKALTILEKAHILIPTGEPNSQGREYLLNLKDRGDYDLDYLNSLDYHPGNPSPDEARAAAQAKRLQGSLFNRPVQSIDQSIAIEKTGLLNKPPAVYSIDTQKQENQKGEISNPIWQKVIESLSHEIKHDTLDYLISNVTACRAEGESFYLVIHSKQARDWIENRLGEKIRSAFSQLEGGRHVRLQTDE